MGLATTHLEVASTFVAGYTHMLEIKECKKSREFVVFGVAVFFATS